MPIFEYQCEDCETRFERLTLGAQTATVVCCSQCGSSQTTKVFSTFSAQTGSQQTGGTPAGTPGFT